jgi:hypothetical protein
MHEKKFVTFQEFLVSSVSYEFSAPVETIMLTTEYTEHLLFPHSRRSDYNDLETCIKWMMSDSKVVTISGPVSAQYLANEDG